MIVFCLFSYTRGALRGSIPCEVGDGRLSLSHGILSFRKKKSPIIFRVEKGTAWWGGKSMIFEINFLSAKSYDLGHIPNFSKPQ